ncbi:mycofactocin-coupled SDR family oxidoreductase [Kitasatospora sp. RG8]|uniref:mycofactocin-coupled SDR family oxidoreductase n=1 Tax=Kitasatospora sp. RG8 TaxID=2820815 RepID=UPI001AE08EBA|nr:mycofactocin-coupled SDR family oxidoreductase [Kitasatospora sp. RG8]MBP0451917.1 mycofactocin-coupled SDR family oxidoreductase [Kitasatospora sp. RG8]
MSRLQDKVVAITGAARGQGRSHAVRCAEEGADVIAVDLCADVAATGYPGATPEDLAETVRLVEKAGRRAFARRADVRDGAAVRAAFADGVAQLGRLDAVVANAGIIAIGADRGVDAFTESVDIDLSGAVNTVHAALPHLGAGGSVVVIGSVAGLLPGQGENPGGPGMAGYMFAKRCLVDYVNTLAVQLGPSGRRINAVHSSLVSTPMILNERMHQVFRPDLDAPGPEDAVPVYESLTALPVGCVEPSDVSHAVVYLLSDESRYVTGLQLKVDGGQIVKAGVGA